jgi:thiol-disulfide isomerase/thioredoxin
VVVQPVEVGSFAPQVPGVAVGDGATGLLFYKVTCPTCQMAAPRMEAFERAYPGRVVGIGQDPQDLLEAFGDEHGMGIRSLSDAPRYGVSDAYGVVTVPTLVIVGGDGTVLDLVQAWDREGFNRASARLAAELGVEPALVSDPSDGLPEFKPG